MASVWSFGCGSESVMNAEDPKAQAALDVKEARKSLKAGEHEAALERLAPHLKDTTLGVAVAAVAVQCYLALERHPDATTVLSKVSPKRIADSRMTRLLHRQLRELEKREDWDGVSKLLPLVAKVLAKNPGDLRLLVLQGRALLKMDRIADFMKDKALQGVADQPLSKSLLSFYARALRERKDWAGIVALVEKQTAAGSEIPEGVQKKLELAQRRLGKS